MQTSIVKWSNIHEHGELWWQHLILRKRLFVDQNHWNIPHNAQAEWDQYDTGNTVYCITHIDNIAIASSRLVPCVANSGNTSMIADAAAGYIAGIPSNIVEIAPANLTTWEATRFCVDVDLEPDQRNAALKANAIALASAARSLGATELVSIMHPGFIRWLKSIGLPATRLGNTVQTLEGDRICAISMPLTN